MCSMANVNTGRKNQSFTDLSVWREGRKPVLSLCKLTENYPVSEQFGLSNQKRRAAVLIASNVAGGFSRSTGKVKAGLYYMAPGSHTEPQNQLPIARDVGYCNGDACVACSTRAIHTSKLLNGLIKTASDRLTHT